jgi:hypothetical protein
VRAVLQRARNSGRAANSERTNAGGDTGNRAAEPKTLKGSAGISGKLGENRGRKGMGLKSFKMGMIRIAILPER